MFTFLISCEHAGNTVPDSYRNVFENQHEILLSHKGWDPGAKEVGQFLASGLNSNFHSQEVTRLLVETNRSLKNPELFSTFTKSFPASEKEKILGEYYFPYRNSVETELQNAIKPVIHFSIHSFTPIFNNVVREVDVGILFDESRRSEMEICNSLFKSLSNELPSLQIFFNEPYKGTDDGFTTYLRKKFPDNEYLGIEIEINQKFINTSFLGNIQESLLKSIKDLNSR